MVVDSTPRLAVPILMSPSGIQCIDEVRAFVYQCLDSLVSGRLAKKKESGGGSEIERSFVSLL